jgi:hypothetical protein
LSHFGEGRIEPDGVADRRFADLVDPTRPGRVTDIVNAASREVGTDAKDWRVDRLVSMVAQLEREARERGGGPE